MIIAAAVVGAWLRRDRAWLWPAVSSASPSASTALPGGVDAAADLARRLPLIAAYREPQKWSALWLVALVVLAACASDALARRGRGEWAGPAVAWGVVVCALFLAGVAEIRSVATIVEPVEYPPYWFHTADYLAGGPGRRADPGPAVAPLSAARRERRPAGGEPCAWPSRGG